MKYYSNIQRQLLHSVCQELHRLLHLHALILQIRNPMILQTLTNHRWKITGEQQNLIADVLVLKKYIKKKSMLNKFLNNKLFNFFSFSDKFHLKIEILRYIKKNYICKFKIFKNIWIHKLYHICIILFFRN